MRRYFKVTGVKGATRTILLTIGSLLLSCGAWAGPGEDPAGWFAVIFIFAPLAALVIAAAPAFHNVRCAWLGRRLSALWFWWGLLGGANAALSGAGPLRLVGHVDYSKARYWASAGLLLLPFLTGAAARGGTIAAALRGKKMEERS